ncbi:MAG: S-layer homology domain-containing protein [Clostridia bacterium]|nr:S-layer homology domain-containing protein [Clostridia bacterium]
MKKIISILLTSFLLFGLCTLCYAGTGSITVDTRFDSAQNGVVAYGTLTTDRANVVLVLTLTSPAPESKVIYSDYLRLPYDGGKTELDYAFPAISLHPKYPSGAYTITVSSATPGVSASAQYDFVGADSQLNAIKAVNDALLADSKAALAEAIGTGYETLGIDAMVFEGLEKNGLLSFNAYMLDKEYELPENINTAENIEKVGDAILAFRADYAAALAIGVFNDIDTVQGFTAWLAENYTSLAADADVLVDEALLYKNAVLYLAYDEESGEEEPAEIADNAETTVNEAELCKYIKRAAEEGDVFMSYVGSGGVLYTTEEIAEAIYESALLTILAERHYTESKDVFEKFPEVFGVDTEELEELDPNELGTAYFRACKKYKTVELAGDALNEIVKDIIDDRNESSGSGTPRRSSKAPSYLAPDAGAEAGESTTGQSTTFPDVPADMWAFEAVTALSGKGIISGDENGSFNPHKNVTRAEYIKLMVLAAKLSLEAPDAGFADVADGDWFKPYLNAAYAAGLIQGDSNKNANPNAYITREDMAVIMYRAYDMYAESEQPLTFTDADSISGYAKNAVAFLAGKSIVSGTGDGSFAPKKNSTRAEAAQIIYNMLSSVESLKTR